MKKELKRVSSIERSNTMVMITYSVMTWILFIAYMIEFVKGSRTQTYTLIFSLLDLLPWTICLFSYLRNKANKQLKYLLGIGFSVLYVYVLFTAVVPVTFVYVYLIFYMIIPYGDLFLCCVTGGVAILANFVAIFIGFKTGTLTSVDLPMVEIQLLATILSATFLTLSTQVIGKINKQRVQEMNEDKEKIESILANTLDISNVIFADIEKVEERMDQLNCSIGTTKEFMNGVAEGANDIAETMQEQLLQTEATVVQINTAKAVVQTITEDINEAEESITTGKENVITLMECVNYSEEAGSEVKSKMHELIESTEQMNTIVELINSITRKTSILSLNATIEAARAGDAGKSFAVVAEEISHLANQTSEATVNITTLIENVTSTINEVFLNINKLMESNEKENLSAKIMEKSFKKIETGMANISKVSIDLENVVRALVESNLTIVNNINNVSASTEEVSANASETLEKCENDKKLVEAVNRTVEEISKKTKQLTS